MSDKLIQCDNVGLENHSNAGLKNPGTTILGKQ